MTLRSSLRASRGAPDHFLHHRGDSKVPYKGSMPPLPLFLGEKDHRIQTVAAQGINCYIYTLLVVYLNHFCTYRSPLVASRSG